MFFGFGEELFDDMAGADGGKTDHGGDLLGWFDGVVQGEGRGRGGPQARILRLAEIMPGAG